jgi:dihydroorotate dehydrogenase electron transfer subunit
LRSPDIARAAEPGQFVMIGFGLDTPGVFMLPRPFSIGWRSNDGRLGILLRVFGQGTRRMSVLERGDRILLLGPLGRPFRTGAERPICCVAGGVGLAPFLFLVGEARAAGHDVTLLYGERSAPYVFDPALIRELTGGVAQIWTEDGSAGSRGLVTQGIDPDDDVLLLACGPTLMLRAVAAFARENGCDLQVSVEEYMACGVGTCQGCVVPGADGRWIKSCTEGPVFDSRELTWPT